VTREAWLLFVAMSLLWGLPYLLIKVAVAELDPTFVVFVRLGLAALVLLPLALARGALAMALRRWRVMLGITVGIVVPFLLIAYGEQHITSSLAALLIAADPLFVALLALRFDATERINGRRLVGLCLGFGGVAALLGLNIGGDALGVLGGVLVLGAAMCYAANALLVKRTADVPPVGATTVSLAMSTLVLLPLAVVRLPTSAPEVPVLASIGVLSVLCTALGYVLYFRLIAVAGATRASLITYVNPAVAVILGAAVLAEPITVSTVVGFVLIVVGCALSTNVSGVFVPSSD
jgi:drug/metabolite transporter (DMT)-like permease